TVLCDPSGGGFTVTLPTGTSNDVGRTVEVKNVSTSANTIAIDGDGANIDGASSLGLSSPLGVVVVQYTGSAWAVIEQTPNRPTCGSFTAATDEGLDTEVGSNAVTLSGDSGMTWPLTVRGDGTPQLELNDDGEWLTHAVAMAGDEVKVKLTSSASPETE